MNQKNILLILVSFFFLGAIVACKKDSGSVANPTSISPDSAAGGQMLTLLGTGLADVRQIIFEKDSVPASFSPVFNTNDALLFRVPDTASGGEQNIIFIKANGQHFTVPIRVLAYPSVTSVSNYNFVPGGQIILTGNNLEDVSAVATEAGTAVTIVSKTKRQLVISMPEVSEPQTKLLVTNSSSTLTTTQDFVNINNAYQIFTDDFQNGFSNGSWGPAQISTTVSKTGTASFAMTYNQGNWSADGFANWDGDGAGNLQAQGYQYLSFWLRGGNNDQILYLTATNKGSGYGNSDATTPLQVPAGVWTYFKLSLENIKLWQNGNNLNQLGWFVQGPNTGNETIYVDDVLFIK